MRILQVTTELRPAGAERVVQLLAGGLQGLGHEVAIVSLLPLPDKSFIVDALRETQIPVHALQIAKTAPWRALGLRSLIDGFKPALVHAHLIHANLTTRLLGGRPAGRSWPLINTVHIAERRPTKAWHFWLDKLTLGRCDCQTAVSQAVASFHAEKLHVPPDTFPVIRNGIEPPAPLADNDIRALREAWGVADCRRVIGSVGRLHWQKGYDRLLRLLPELSGTVPDGEQWAVVLIGDGPQREELQILAAQPAPRLRVVLPGFRPDASSAMGAFDLFVMPSRYEGFGLTLAEAMAHGLPVLPSQADSLPELLACYPHGEAIDYDAAPGTVIGHLHKWVGVGKRAAISPFTTDRMVDGYLALYERLLSR